MSSQQISESTFVSIIEIPSYMQPWPIFNEVLHAKFWGKNMADEEQQWLNAQQASPTTGSEFGLRDQEGEEHVDEATTMDPDNDIILVVTCSTHQENDMLSDHLAPGT